MYVMYVTSFFIKTPMTAFIQTPMTAFIQTALLPLMHL